MLLRGCTDGVTVNTEEIFGERIGEEIIMGVGKGRAGRQRGAATQQRRRPVGGRVLDRRSEYRCGDVRRGVDSAWMAFTGIYSRAAGKHRKRSEDRDRGSGADNERREAAIGRSGSEALSRV